MNNYEELGRTIIAKQLALKNKDMKAFGEYHDKEIKLTKEINEQITRYSTSIQDTSSKC